MESLLLRVRLLLGAMALGYGAIFVLCALLVIYMRHHRSGALRGDTRAARRVLLPAFQPLLWLLTAVSLVYTVVLTLLLTLGPGLGDSGRLKTEVYYSGRLFVMALPVLYLQQQAVTTRALVRASLLSLLLAVYNIPIVWLGDSAMDAETAHYLTMTTGALPLLVFGWVCLRPSERASRKTLREYAAFIGVYYLLRLAYTELFFVGESNVSFTVCLAGIFWGSLVPVVIWRVLKADTAHWRGLGRRAVHLQSLFRQKHHFLHERVSSRGLHVLIEMHRKQIIDFAYLELQRKIGAGASAVVFRGTLHSKIPVAVKVYTPRVLTEDVVAEFSHEAALCGALHHPNVVRFYGLCVCPPTVCLVSELCQASLEDVTRTSARLRQLHRRSLEEDLEQGRTPQDKLHKRQQLLIDLNYMIDATRAVVYMHSFTPAFLHRDLKPSNFLVDDYGTCKLTDFGESRSVPMGPKSDKLKSVSEDCSTTAATTATVFFGDSEPYMGVQTPTTSTPFAPPPLSLRPSMRVRGRSAMTVRGTADYMAPELIEGKAGTAVYGEAADIYSLAITLWDIAHPLGSKYPEATRSHLQVFDSVLNGERPPLGSSLHPELRRLLTDAWHQQPERRPSATYILTALETLQQEVSAQTALGLATALERAEAPSMVNGQVLMQRMLQLDFVDSASEAYRMGNSLMSAGFLHHSHHQESFRKTSELFYFDADVLDLYAPATPNSALQTPSSVTTADFTDECTPLTSRSSNRQRHRSTSQHRRATDSPVATRCFSPPAEKRRSSMTACHRASAELPTCACRKLGRGFGQERGQKRRFRRNKKWFAIMEESISTGKLLSLDVESHPSLAETDEFEEYATSGNWEDMESGGTTGMNASDVVSVNEDLELDLDDADNRVHVSFESDWGTNRSSVVII